MVVDCWNGAWMGVVTLSQDASPSLLLKRLKFAATLRTSQTAKSQTFTHTNRCVHTQRYEIWIDVVYMLQGSVDNVFYASKVLSRRLLNPHQRTLSAAPTWQYYHRHFPSRFAPSAVILSLSLLCGGFVLLWLHNAVDFRNLRRRDSGCSTHTHLTGYALLAVVLD